MENSVAGKADVTGDENMEERILRAAEELFLEHGFAKTTMGQIAKAARCNQALVHYYYRSKERLFEHVFEDKVRSIVANILAIDAGEGSDEGSFERKIVRMVGAHFDFLIQNPLYIPFIIGELLANPERFVPLLDHHGHYPHGVFAMLDAELRREVERGTIRPIAASDLIATIMSLNVMPFLVWPAIRRLGIMPDVATEAWLAARRQENIDTILARLRIESGSDGGYGNDGENESKRENKQGDERKHGRKRWRWRE